MLKRTSLAIAVGVLALAAAMPSHAQSASACTFESKVHISPGVGPTPSPGTFATPSPGTITCHGAIEGTGTIEYSGVTGMLGESCALDVGGSGTLHYVIGSNDITGTFTFSRVAVAGGFMGTAGSGTIQGAFEFMPDSGQDCATVPVTDATVEGQAVILY